MPESPTTIATTLALAAAELGAWVLLALAAGALAVAVRSAAARPGGLRGLLVPGGRGRDDSTQTADELHALIAEARRLSDELADRFDGRAADMARLLQEADRRVARLEQVLRAEGHALTPATGDRAAPTPQGPTPDHPHRASPRPASMVEPAAHLSSDPMAREIYRLADEGLAPVEIAGRLGQHTGKVELILALRRG